MNAHCQQREKIRQSCRHKLYPELFHIALFQLPSQTPHVCFHSRKRVHHPALEERLHTTAHTAKQGRFRWGRYYYPRRVPHVREHPRAGYQNGVLCRFGALAGGAPEERRKPSEQRCAYARRCSEASRPRWAA